MANYFEITPPEGLSVVKLDSSGRAKVQYTVKNVSGIKRDGRAVVVSVPSAPGAVEKNFVKVDPPAEKPFDPGQSQTFTVSITVPPKSPPGTYAFRLDTVLVARPDEGDKSSPITFNVVEAAPRAAFKWWIPVAAIVALLIIGGVLWLVLSKKKSSSSADTGSSSSGSSSSDGGPKKSPGGTRPRPVSRGDCTSGPDTCIQGYVWRDASASDHVCVTPGVRQQAATDNALAPSRRDPRGGPYGPDTCLQGFVWRDAFANDHVCVTGDTRSQAAADNAAAQARRACE